MRGTKKNLSIDMDRAQLMKRMSRKRHYSLTGAVILRPSQGVMELVNILLDRVMEEDKKKQLRVKKFNKIWKEMDQLADTYYTLQIPLQPQVISKLEEEPQPEEKKVIGLALLKRTLRKIQQAEEVGEIQQSARSSILQTDRKDRDGLIQRLKKQYSAIINSRYLSESMPIGESRADFMQPDTPLMQQYRRELNKAAINKKGNNKRWKDSITRKQNKVSTIYKKNINYIQKIDPTNSMYKSSLNKSVTHTVINRKSINYFDGTFLLEQPVIAKESTFREVSNSVKPSKEIANILGLKSVKESVRFPNIESCGRDEISKRIGNSLHCHNNVKMKRQTQRVDRQTRMNSSLSISYLPKISNRT